MQAIRKPMNKTLATLFVLGSTPFLLGGVNTVKRMIMSSAAGSVNVTDDYQPGTHSFAFVTAPNEEVAKKIARGLVESKLAACVNVIPKITSIYEWQGKIEEDTEVMMMIKTRTSRLEDLTKYVKDNHPYDVPEVISSKIDQGNPAYLKWIGDLVPEKS
jgi:periplasmic divalent cation tolerance protein